MIEKVVFVFACFVLLPALAQVRQATWPLSPVSFRQIMRASFPVPAGRSPTLEDVRLVHYWKNSRAGDVYFYKNITRILKNDNFGPRRPTIVYLHGFIEEIKDDSVKTIVKAYLRRGGFNILVLDWANMAFGNYFTAVRNCEKVGKETARVLSKLVKGGLRADGLHIIGFSLGGQLGGSVARAMKSYGYTIPRLTGLDPALPGFYPPLIGTPMSSKDAIFVDVIHTDGGLYGTPVSTGHADFWPNGGMYKQPGCKVALPLTVEELCSHWRSWLFFAESVNNAEYIAKPCTNYDDFLRGRCDDAPHVWMGFHSSFNLRGNFYLRTAPRAPYALGVRGAG